MSEKSATADIPNTNIIISAFNNILSALFSFPETNGTFSSCSEGCNKPGLGSPSHNPYDNKLSDCALICCPCTFILDLVTCPYRSIYPPNNDTN